MNAPANIHPQKQRVISRVKSVFLEAFKAGQHGKFFDEAWRESESRARLMRPAKSSMSAIERRDKALYFFEEGLREGHSSADPETAWFHSYSLVIAKDMADRTVLRDG